MPESFAACEYRLVQQRGFISAANDTSLTMNVVVPAGKIWSVIGVGYRPSVAETKVVSMSKCSPVSEYGILNPISLALNPAYATPIEQGLWIDLLPGEYLKVYRDSATAGSTMSLVIEFVEWDIPLYDYTEPQAAARTKRLATSMADLVSRVAGRGGSGAGVSPGPSGAGRIPVRLPK